MTRIILFLAYGVTVMPFSPAAMAAEKQDQISADARPIPPIDRKLPEEIKTATFAMG